MKSNGFKNRGKPMKRTGFKSPARAPRAPVVVVPLTKAPNYARTSVAAPVPKATPVRSEPYRRLVASLPCINCGIEGFTQHAHANQGKGMALKVCDLLAFPLCADRPGQVGCHTGHDQGALLPRSVRREVEQEWARRTVRFLIGAGRWPAGLPVPDWAAA